MHQSTDATAPITSSERIGELDVLRGFALLGVFVVHFVSSLYFLYPVDEATTAAWSENGFQYALVFLCDLLFLDKAITLFSVLFGIGFWIQMQRFAEKGAGAEKLYLRRLTILLLFGVINKFLLFPGDILLDYALFGFALYFARNLSSKTMLVAGLLFVFIISNLAYAVENVPWVDGDALDQELNNLLLSESYSAWVSQLAQWHFADNIIGLGILPLAFFVMGRFLIGAWIARHNIIEAARSAKPLVSRIALAGIAVGLALEALTLAIWDEMIALPAPIATIFHAIGVPLLALGYASLLILLCGSARWNWLTQLFAPVGRMALTAYIGHGILILIIAHPFGVYLRPDMSPAISWLTAIGVFLTMSIFCRLWLNAFRFGPLEWVWRSLTYGERQPLRRIAPNITE